jgi:hypothetical protein
VAQTDFLRAHRARGDRALLSVGLALAVSGAGLALLFYHWFPAILLVAGLLALAERLRQRLSGARHPVYAQLARFGDPLQLAAEVNREFSGVPADDSTHLGERWLAQGDTYGVALVPWGAVVWLVARREVLMQVPRTIVEVWTRDGRRLVVPCRQNPGSAEAMLQAMQARAPWAEVGRTPELEREWRHDRAAFLARVEARRRAIE